MANETLKNFLVTNLEKPESTEKCDFRLGISCPKLGSAIQVSGSPLRAITLLLRQASMPRRIVWEEGLLQLSAAMCVVACAELPSLFVLGPGRAAVPVRSRGRCHPRADARRVHTLSRHGQGAFGAPPSRALRMLLGMARAQYNPCARTQSRREARGWPAAVAAQRVTASLP